MFGFFLGPFCASACRAPVRSAAWDTAAGWPSQRGPLAGWWGRGARTTDGDAGAVPGLLDDFGAMLIGTRFACNVQVWPNQKHIVYSDTWARPCCGARPKRGQRTPHGNTKPKMSCCARMLVVLGGFFFVMFLLPLNAARNSAMRCRCCRHHWSCCRCGQPSPNPGPTQSCHLLPGHQSSQGSTPTPSSRLSSHRAVTALVRFGIAANATWVVCLA